MLLSFLSNMVATSIYLLMCFLLVRITQVYASTVSVTYVNSPGAVCLDGTPPAFYLSKGSGDGIDNWMVFLQGGGWCNSHHECLKRAYGRDINAPGSSNGLKSKSFKGILSNDRTVNPDFYNWNRVYVFYCDGSSYTSDVDRPYGAWNRKVYFRGARIYRAIMDKLLDMGMAKATNALLCGSSSGGLGTILHCDHFRSLLPFSANVKCVSDGGFFINAKDINGKSAIEKYYDQVVTLHESAQNLPTSCTSIMNSSLCFFAQNVVPFVETPLFIVNSALDFWQVHHILLPNTHDPCMNTLENCNSSITKAILDLRTQYTDLLEGLKGKPLSGMLISSCLIHIQIESYFNARAVGNETIKDAIGDWFNVRREVNIIDSNKCSNGCAHCIK